MKTTAAAVFNAHKEQKTQPLAMRRRNDCSSYSADGTDLRDTVCQVVRLCSERLLPRSLLFQLQSIPCNKSKI